MFPRGYFAPGFFPPAYFPDPGAGTSGTPPPGAGDLTCTISGKPGTPDPAKTRIFPL
jgi:hypothetical protein